MATVMAGNSVELVVEKSEAIILEVRPWLPLAEVDDAIGPLLKGIEAAYKAIGKLAEEAKPLWDALEDLKKNSAPKADQDDAYTKWEIKAKVASNEFNNMKAKADELRQKVGGFADAGPVRPASSPPSSSDKMGKRVLPPGEE